MAKPTRPPSDGIGDVLPPECAKPTIHPLMDQEINTFYVDSSRSAHIDPPRYHRRDRTTTCGRVANRRVHKASAKRPPAGTGKRVTRSKSQGYRERQPDRLTPQRSVDV
jgi:hypothetical protein